MAFLVPVFDPSDFGRLKPMVVVRQGRELGMDFVFGRPGWTL